MNKQKEKRMRQDEPGINDRWLEKQRVIVDSL